MKAVRNARLTPALALVALAALLGGAASGIGFVSTGPGSGPTFSCNDGLDFWVLLHGAKRLARF